MSRGWTGARGDYHPTDVDDLLEWLDEPMDAHVPAPEEQGDARKCGACGHWAHGTEECMAFMRSGSNPPITSCRCTNSEEQQGEPVCARCGHPEFASDGSAVHISERDLDGGDDSDDWCIGCANEKRPIWGHPFEPAPPPSEEAEARFGVEVWREADQRYPLPREGGYGSDLVNARRWAFFNGATFGWAKGRSPLEERVRDLRRWAEIDHANLEALEEELDRLREHHNDTVEAMMLWRGRAEAAEAQVHELRTALAEALTDIKDGWKDSAATVIRRALAARQEEGEAAP